MYHYDNGNTEGSHPPTTMHKLAYACNWNGLLQRLEEFPEEGLQTVEHSTWMLTENGDFLLEDDLIIDDFNLTPLHIICTRRDVPINIINAYLQAQPTATQLLTRLHRTPIHLACYSKKSLEVIQLLAQADPDSLSRQETFDGWNVFHICAHCDTEKDVLAMLLNVAGPDRGAGALDQKDKRGKTPLLLACNVRPKISKIDFSLLHQASSARNLERSLLEELSANYRSYIASALQLQPPPNRTFTKGDPSSFCNPQRSISVERFWSWRPMDALALSNCMNKMLVVLGAGQGSDIATYPLLHEYIRQDPDCKTNFFYCILSMNPHYANQYDVKGDLALHVAARHAENTKEWRNRLNALVVIYPRGPSLVNRAGKLPLQLLVKKDVSWDHMRLLVRCCPAALSRLRIPESCYADILEKLDKKGSRATFFFILKETPSLFDRL